MANAGVAAEVASLEEFRARVPFTVKSDLAEDQQNHPPYGTNITYPLEQYTRFCQTSGTKARPLSILDTAESWEWMLGNWQTIYRESGIRLGDSIYFAFSFGPFLGFWTAFEAALRLGCRCLPGGGLSSSARLRGILDHGATALCCTPTYALHLAATAQSEGIDLSQARLRRIIVAGEPGGSIPSVRTQVESAWPGAEVIDHYGMTEVGPVAYQRPGEYGRLHVIEEAYLAEVVDPATGAETLAGEVGELVLTTLGREACPLFRYRTGDLVRRATGETGFMLEGGILGRADDMIVVRGVNLYPSAVEAVVRTVAEIAEYRVRVKRGAALCEVEIDVEAAPPTAAEALERALSAAFSLRIPVVRVSAGTLPRYEMKARRWHIEERS